MVPNLTEKYDQDSELFLLSYLFVYNFIETLAKCIPPRVFVSSLKKLHHRLETGPLSLFFRVHAFESTHLPGDKDAELFASGRTRRVLNRQFLLLGGQFRSKQNKRKCGYAMMCALSVGVLAETLADSLVLWLSE